MKKAIFLLLMIPVISVKIFAQTTATSITGIVLDDKSTPLEAATISLMKASDSSLVKLSVTNKEGKFLFQNIPLGSYYVNVSAINYVKQTTTVFDINNLSPVKNIDAIVLQQQTKSLSNVTVISKKPLLEQKLDRMVVNVDASVTNVGSTALEILERSPGVSIDKDGKISLKGKPEVLVMVDGKPSYLSSSELANLLSNMNSNQINQIEIMTNPSAKYDASGNAGVINIKTKKNSTKGFNGSVTLNYGQGVFPKSNNSIMLNYRNTNMNAFLNYGYTLNKGFMNVDANRKFLDSTGKTSYTLDQTTHNLMLAQNNNLKLGFDYYIHSKTTIGFVASGFIAPQDQNSFTTSYLEDVNGNTTSIEKTTRTVDNQWKNGTLNINFHTSFDSSKKDLTGNFDYLHYDFSGNQNVNGNTYNAGGILQSTSYLHNILPLKIDVYSARLDYVQSLKNGLKIDAGIKASIVKTSNSTQYYTIKNNEQKLLDSLSNNFNYTENINAAYVNLNKKFGDFNVQVGLRAENTNYKGLETSKSGDSSFSRNYVNLFPTAFISYELDAKNQFGLSIGRRIDRPEYQQLNPFISIVDRYMQLSGNPYLQPQFSNNIELSHTYKNIFTTTLNYSVIHDMINETLLHKDSIIIRSVGNIGTRYNFGISESATIPFTKWYTGVFFVNLYENKYDGAIAGYSLNAKQVALSLNINNQFSFQHGLSAELSGTYTTKDRDEGQALSLPIGQVSAGISKSLLNNKASLKFNIRDIFYTNIIRETQNFQDVQSTISRSRDSQVFNIAFVWRFGMQSKPKAIQQTEEQNRIKVN